MRKECMLFLLALIASFLGIGLARAQSEVRLGDCTFMPEENITSRATRSAARSARLDLGAATGGRHNVLLQFKELPTPRAAQLLARMGVSLADYLGGNAYWAQLPEGMDARRALARSGVRSVMPTRPEWKVRRSLLDGDVPPWARRGTSSFAFTLRYASNASAAQVRADLARFGARSVVVREGLRIAEGDLPIESVRSVAALGYVLLVESIAPPSVLENHEGASLGGAAVLARSAAEGGRGLTGKGIRVGIWDGNIEDHPDFSDRLTRMEFESEAGSQHGTHVAGTLFGRGLQDPRARGMAPEASVWAYNFGKQRNGLLEAEEMAQARKDFGITITQNSYGISLAEQYYSRYSYLQIYQILDRLYFDNPLLTGVYSAGNDQGHGGDAAEEAHGAPRYGTSAKRAKNVLHIGALEADGSMTEYSSWGPMDDGRMLPTVCAKGDAVYSTKPGGGYQAKDGTSMACPTASGHIALIQERYRQVSSGEDLRSDLLRAALVTAATDAGRPGPDYCNGFGILNAVKTVEILENKTYHRGEFSQGATAPNQFTVRVPAGAKSLRVSLAWLDPVAEKEYAYGESALINDLDLKVAVAGSDYLPLVCDPKQAAENAVQKEDHVNNTEQVMIRDLQGDEGKDVTITVSPHRVAQGEQVYYVAYQFSGDEVRIVSPRGGDELELGVPFNLRLEGVFEAYAVELSTDGGKTYHPLVHLDEFDATRPHCSNLKIAFPEGTTATREAKLRVITASGRVAYSEGSITISPCVRNVIIEGPDCGVDGFKLRWETVGTAKEGFVVLRGDSRSGIYEVLAEVAADASEYALKPADLVMGACYTVACKRGNGWGTRALGVLLRIHQPIVVKKGALPWQEAFTAQGSRYFTVNTDRENRQSFKASDDPALPLGTHMHLVTIDSEIKDFNDAAPFSDKHKKNIVDYEFCSLDLRDIDASTTLMLRIRLGMTWAPVNATRGPWFRVLLDGKPLPDAAGVEVHERLEDIENLYYPISGGGEHTLALQFVGKYNVDRLAIYQIAVEEKSVRRDVGLTLVSVPRRKAKHTSDEKVTINLRNKSGAAQERVGLQLLRNGMVVYQTVAESLLPHERRDIVLPVDLTTQNVLGEKFRVEVRAILPGDEQPDDNRVDFEIINIGSVFAMPRGNIMLTPSGVVPVDPKRTYTLSEGERLLFTDDGGALSDYYYPQVSTLKVLPSRAGRAVRVSFKEFSSHAEGAHLLVYCEPKPNSMDINGLFIDKELIGTPAMPYSTISRAADGALMFFLEARMPGAGWIAEIDEVPIQNPITLAKAFAVGKGTAAEGEVEVRATLRNNFLRPLENVTLRYYLNDEQRGEEQNLQLAAGEEKDFVFAKMLKLKSGLLNEVKVWVECPEDSDGADNALSTAALYDPYLEATHLRDAEVASIGSIEYLDQKCVFPSTSKLTLVQQHFPRYRLADTLTLFKALRDEGIFIKKLKAAAGDAVRLWVDWNDDKRFDSNELAAELQINDEATDLSNPSFTALKGLSSAASGDKRARIAVGKKEELEKLAYGSELARGCIYNFIVRVKDGTYPSVNDLAIKQVLLTTADGKALQPGSQLPNEVVVELELVNNGIETFKGAFEVDFEADGKQHSLKIDLKDLKDKAIAPFGKGSCKVQLEPRVDLSAVGRHEVNVTIKEIPGVVNAENNKANMVVYSCVPEGKNYALSFRSSEKDNREYLKLPKGYSKSTRKATIEFWAFLREPSFNIFMETRGAVIFSSYRMKEGFPDNSLGIMLREGFFYTKANTLLPGRWNHIAITLDEIKAGTPLIAGSCKATAYINGEKHELSGAGPDGTDAFDAPLLGTRLNGMLDEFRLWGVARTQEEIKANMYRHLPADGRAGLAYEFSFSDGQFNKFATGVDAAGASKVAEIIDVSDARLEGKEGVWYLLSEQPQFVESNFAGQTKVEVAADGVHKVYFKKGTNLESLTASFITTWPCTKVLQDGQLVTSETAFNLSGGRKITLNFESELFGEKYSSAVTFEGVEDASEECELLTLVAKQDENSGLTADLSPKNIVPCMELASATAPDKPDQVVIRYTVSAGAELLYDGKALQDGEAIDLTKPAVLTVRAADGRTTKCYSVGLSVATKAAIKLTDGEYTYGDKPVQIKMGSADDASRLVWSSTDTRVASVADGKLQIGVPGEATVKVWMSKRGIYAASQPVAAKIKVRRRTIEATPSVASIEYGASLDWTFTYSPAITEVDAVELSGLHEKAGYKIFDAAGQASGLGERLLPGEYALKPSKATLETEKFEVRFKEQKGFKVSPRAGFASLRFVVTNDDGAAVDGAVVEVAGRRLTTDGNGVCIQSINTGVYTYTVRHAGCQLHRATMEVKESIVECAVKLLKTKCTLRYTVSADGGGAIFGSAEQHVADGASGELVEAIAKEGYSFVAWSDGLATARRVDRDVKSDIAVQARFERVSAQQIYTVTYRIDGHGVFVDGGSVDRTLEVRAGDALPAVTVVPAGEDAYFVGWSDGMQTPSRPAGAKVEADITLIARFDSYAKLPLRETFEADGLPPSWRSETTYPRPDCRWKVFKGTVPLVGASIASNAATIITSEKMSDNPTIYATALRLPKIDLHGVENDLSVVFDWMFFCMGDSLLLTYSVDGGKPIKVWGKSDDVQQLEFIEEGVTIPAAEVRGKKSIEFTFIYKSAEFSFFAAIDNLNIYEASSRSLSVSFVSEPSGMATFSAKGAALSGPLSIKVGEKMPDVEVHPEAGYIFKEWLIEGEKISPKDYGRVCKPVVVTAVLEKVNEVTLVYGIEPPLAGEVRLQGKAVMRQRVEKGQTAAAVAAVPSDGFAFSHWADNGSTQAARAGEVVNGDARIIAVFKPVTELVTFMAKDKKTNAPLSDTRIVITDAQGHSSFYTTAASGEVQVKLPLGEFTYTVQRDGYVAQAALALNVTKGMTPVTLSLVPFTEIVPLDIKVVDAESGSPVNGATVVVGVVEQQSGLDGLVHFELAPDPYVYSVRCMGYKTISYGVVEVPLGDVLRISLRTDKPEITVAFTVADNVNKKPLQGATLRVGEKAAKTDANGLVSLQLTEGTHECVAVREGYVEVKNEIEVKPSMAAVDITLQPKQYAVVVEVRDAFGNLFVGADVTFDGIKKQTEKDGTVLFESLAAGLHSYSVACEGYLPIAEKKIYIVNEDRRVAEVLEVVKSQILVIVSSKGALLPKASIIFTDGDKGTTYGPFETDVNGQVRCKIPHVELEYEVKAASVAPKKGRFSFANQEVLLIDLEAEPIELTCITPSNGELEVLASGIRIVARATIYKGSTLAIKATPAAGYRLKAITFNGKERSESILSEQVHEDVVVAATFELIKHAVTYSVTAGQGKVVVTSGGNAIASGDEVAAGSEIVVTAEPADGFSLESLMVNGTGVASGSKFTVQSAMQIEAAFRENAKTAVVSGVLARVYAAPNPFVDAIILGKATDVQRYAVVSLQGVEVLRGEGTGTERIAIPASHLAPGVYILTVYGEEGERQIRLVKQL